MHKIIIIGAFIGLVMIALWVILGLLGMSNSWLLVG